MRSTLTMFRASVLSIVRDRQTLISAMIFPTIFLLACAAFDIQLTDQGLSTGAGSIDYFDNGIRSHGSVDLPSSTDKPEESAQQKESEQPTQTEHHPRHGSVVLKHADPRPYEQKRDQNKEKNHGQETLPPAAVEVPPAAGPFRFMTRRHSATRRRAAVFQYLEIDEQRALCRIPVVVADHEESGIPMVGQSLEIVQIPAFAAVQHSNVLHRDCLRASSLQRRLSTPDRNHQRAQRRNEGALEHRQTPVR